MIGTPDGFYDEEDPFYFPDAMADRAIEWLHGIRAQDAEKPFFVYLLDRVQPCPAPRRADLGGQVRGEVRSGVGPAPGGDVRAPEGARASYPRTPNSPHVMTRSLHGNDVPETLKAFYTRQMEVYAGFSENADHNAGRVIDAIEELGELDNTVIVWIWGDNGASMEGTVTGSFNELTMQNGIPLTDEMQLQLAERYGGSTNGGRRSWTRTTERRGHGRGTPRSSGASRSDRTWGARVIRWWSAGRVTSPTPAGCGPSSVT